MERFFVYGQIPEDRISFHDVTIEATPAILFNVLGEPNAKSGDGKSNHIWDIIFNDKSYSVYDYKYYRELQHDESIIWNIAGKTKIDCYELKVKIDEEIEKQYK